MPGSQEKCLRGMSLVDENLYSTVCAALRYLQVEDAKPCTLILHPDGRPMHEVVEACTAPLLVLGDDAGLVLRSLIQMTIVRILFIYFRSLLR